MELFKVTGHLNLGEIIELLAAEDPDRVLPVGFTNPHSFRGYYSELAFEPATDVRIGDMLADAQAALGHTFQGWRGGWYKMEAYTTCWIAEEGHSGDDCIGPLMMRLLLGQKDPRDF